MVKIINSSHFMWTKESTHHFLRLSLTFSPHKALWFVNILLQETSDLPKQKFLTVSLKECLNHIRTSLPSVSGSCHNLKDFHNIHTKLWLLVIHTNYLLFCSCDKTPWHLYQKVFILAFVSKVVRVHYGGEAWQGSREHGNGEYRAERSNPQLQA